MTYKRSISLLFGALIVAGFILVLSCICIHGVR